MTVEERTECAFMEILNDLCDRRDIKRPLDPFRCALDAAAEGEPTGDELETAREILATNAAIIARHIREAVASVKPNDPAA
jgi:hypothetical protein